MDTATGLSAKIPWNKGKILGQKAPLKLKDIWATRIRLQLGHRTRELALFDLGLDSKLPTNNYGINVPEKSDAVLCVMPRESSSASHSAE